MSYKIIVFVKQVPDTKNVTGEAMKPDGTINRAALPAIFNKRTGASQIHETLPLEFPKEPADQASLLSRYS